ncbi:MAG: undecaprenyl-phosphate galactose phosphotransferase WbaP [Firmicutes bacterium]|nr:undecaprenyl-phosphate galactose phosphotransferase WbaP [Bacillota bacterium]
MSQDLAQHNFIERADKDLFLAKDAYPLPLAGGRQSMAQIPAVVVLASIDLAILTLALSLAFLIRLNVLPLVTPIFPMAVPPTLFSWLWALLIIGIFCLAYEGLYTKRLHFWQEAKQLVKSMTLVFIILLALVSLGKLSGEVSRTVLVLTYLISVILLPLGRFLGKSVLTRAGIGIQPVLILGAGDTGRLVANSLLRERYLGYRIIGFLDEDRANIARNVPVNGTLFPVLGSFRDSDRLMRETGVRNLIVAVPDMPSRDLVGLVNRLQRSAASVTVIPDLFDLPVLGVEADYSFDDRMLSFRIRNNLANPLNILAKRLFDLVVGSLILVVALPLMTLIAIAIKLDSPGPVFFSHRRIGRGGREFRCYKFRTMYQNNDEILRKYLEDNPQARYEWERFAKLRGYDPRVTRVGRLLRKFSLDELPQIFNVLKGDMSLVGPRPYLLREAAKLGRSASSILLARPGITGLWQVSGRNNIDFEGRLKLESWYVRNWSLWLDISLLVRTVGVVLARRGAY